MLHSIYLRLLDKLRRHKPNLNNPVLIYQMGKVASSSIWNSLKHIKKINAIHVHRMNPENINNIREECLRHNAAVPNDDIGLYLFNNLIKKKTRTKIITMIREPISRNLSAYFQNMDSIENTKNYHQKQATNKIINSFLSNYNHNVPLTWFDIEMKATTGIDIYNHEFPKTIGYQVINLEPFQLLLMYHDLDDSIKQDVISDFIGVDNFRLYRENESNKKNYASKYKSVLEKIILPNGYIDLMLDSKYTKHFYSSRKIESIRRKWSSN